MRLRNKLVPISILVVAVALLFAQNVMAIETGHITPEEGQALIQQREDLVIVDMRNPHEFVTEHFPNALNIPVNELETRLDEIPSGVPVLVHCIRGMRSKRGYEILREMRPDIEELFHIYGEPIFY